MKLCGIACFFAATVTIAHAEETKENTATSNQVSLTFSKGEVVSQQTEQYKCTINTKKQSEEQKTLLNALPEGGDVSVTYISADLSSLAILPIDGKTLIFSNVIAASGAKYSADRYIWWSQGDQAFFSRADGSEKNQVFCKVQSSN
ncbi:hypothetical protein GT348_01070 [Aristophania vespae]|uniref:C-type lysozyme inhibitor domain-containing protein n=2 Tax=Aristophania vespae TaxID=2697033 RepID=A0A6P1NCF4_9PROT|nr:hypothetical protein GT348_01070 [Aristophania vespae]